MNTRHFTSIILLADKLNKQISKYTSMHTCTNKMFTVSHASNL